jgi:hypothetical protein
MGRRLGRLTSSVDGIVVGLKMEPLVNRGDAIVHIAAIVAQETL